MTARTMTLTLICVTALAASGLTGCKSTSPEDAKGPQILIQTQPADGMVLEGSNAVFSVVARGDDLEFQWQFNGADQRGATGSSLTVNQVDPSKLGLYSCRITSGKKSTMSQSAALLMYNVNSAGALSSVQGPLRPTPRGTTRRCAGKAIKVKGYCSVANTSGVWFPVPANKTHCVVDTFDLANNAYDTLVTATAKFPPLPDPSCNDNAQPRPPTGFNSKLSRLKFNVTPTSLYSFTIYTKKAPPSGSVPILKLNVNWEP